MVVPAINLFLSLILQKFSLCLREVGERNIIKFAGDRKSRIFKWNVAEPLQRWKVIRYSIISRLLQGSQLIILRGKLFAIRPQGSPRTFQENGENA